MILEDGMKLKTTIDEIRHDRKTSTCGTCNEKEHDALLAHCMVQAISERLGKGAAVNLYRRVAALAREYGIGDQ
jgi:hypothetical protein